MGEKEAIKRLQKQIGELQQSLDDVRKLAEKQLGKAASETDALRRELLKRIGAISGDSDDKKVESSDAPRAVVAPKPTPSASASLRGG